ncbi:MAG: hypothetical protein Kow00105_00180 [Phycisphaeraceae bacterium]
MFDPSRYRGLAVAGAGLLLTFALCNAVFFALLGPNPSVFNDADRQLAWTQLELMGAQVAGVELEMRRPGENQPPFGVVLGQSTTLRGIDPAILQQQAHPPMRWLLINGFGSSFGKLYIYAKPLLASHLKPDTILLGVHETMLAGQRRRQNSPTTGQGNVQATDSGWRLRRKIKQLIWIRTHRADISHAVNMKLFDARLALHGFLHSGAVGLFRPTDEPWVSPERDELPDRRPDSFLSRQINGWRDFGWYDPSSYDIHNEQAQAFRKLIQGCLAMEPRRVVIVLMPITSDLRSWLPPEADRAIRTLIEELRAEAPIELIDLRTAMPDEYFADYAHLNPQGRARFSTILADKISHSKESAKTHNP